MAIRTMAKASSKATQKVRTENVSKDKVQANGNVGKPRAPIVKNMDERTHAIKLLSSLMKADGNVFDADNDDDKHALDMCMQFIAAETRDPRSQEELAAWADTPWISSGKRKDQRPWTPYGKFLQKLRKDGIAPINPQPTAKGRVREAAQITSPGPRLDIATAKKLRQPEEGKSTAKDRIVDVPVSPVCPEGVARMASKKESTRKGKGRYGLTVKDAQAALKEADGTPSKGYAATITALCKSLFAGLTVSALKAEEINKLVEVARENGLIG